MAFRSTADVARRIEPLLRRLDPRRGADRPFAVSFWDGSELPATTPEPAFELQLRRPDALAHLLREPGELGLARAWVSGALDVDGDLETAFSQLSERAEGAHIGPRDWAELAATAARLRALRPPRIPSVEARVRGRLHSLRRDSAAVRHHYDVPTDFYRLVLGPSLVYSCAVFASPDDTLESAQERKLDIICRKLDLREGERFLDVGCGWGSLVLHAAANYGVRATGVTLSPPQAAEARRRIADAGLSERCEVRVLDYRELRDGPYDKVASVGMYEHVGRAELARYVSGLRDLLRPGGRVVNAGITRLMPRPPRRRRFIDRYVFPDGELHPIGDLVALLGDAGFEVLHLETFREHYARTLRSWVDNLVAHKDEAARLVGTERVRVWRLYMAASAHAFQRGELGVYHTLAVAPRPQPDGVADGSSLRG